MLVDPVLTFPPSCSNNYAITLRHWTFSFDLFSSRADDQPAEAHGGQQVRSEDGPCRDPGQVSVFDVHCAVVYCLHYGHYLTTLSNEIRAGNFSLK